MKFKILFFLFTLFFLAQEVFADGCNNGPFQVIHNCSGADNPLEACVWANNSSDDPATTHYSWDWGDGSSATNIVNSANSPTVCHTYSASGTYNITLTMDVGSVGSHCVSSGSVTVTNNPQPFNIDTTLTMNFSNNTGTLTVHFPGGSNIIWDWDPDTTNAIVYPLWPLGMHEVSPPGDTNKSIAVHGGEQHLLFVQYDNCFYQYLYKIPQCATLTVCKNNDGTLTVSGGTSPYTWQAATNSTDCSGCPLGMCTGGCTGTKKVTWSTFATGTTVTSPAGKDTIKVADNSGNYFVITDLSALQTGFCQTTGVKGFSEQSFVSVFPNPSNRMFNVQVSIGSGESPTVEVYNVLGEKIYSSQVTDYRIAITLDLASHPRGIYFLKVKTSEGIVVKKIIKE